MKKAIFWVVIDGVVNNNHKSDGGYQDVLSIDDKLYSKGTNDNIDVNDGEEDDNSNNDISNEQWELPTLSLSWTTHILLF